MPSTPYLSRHSMLADGKYQELLDQLGSAPGTKASSINHYLSEHTSTNRLDLLTHLHQEGHIAVSDLLTLAAAPQAAAAPPHATTSPTAPNLKS